MITVRQAEVTDIQAILRVLNNNLIANKKSIDVNELERSGFLLNPFTAEYLMAALEKPESTIILVAIKNKLVIGYIIAYKLREIEPEFYQKLLMASDNLKEIKDSCELYYLRQVAKDSMDKQVGTALIQALFERVKKKRYSAIVSQILHKPYLNNPSIALHKKMGFMEVGEISSGDEHLLGIYLRQF